MHEILGSSKDPLSFFRAILIQETQLECQIWVLSFNFVTHRYACMNRLKCLFILQLRTKHLHFSLIHSSHLMDLSVTLILIRTLKMKQY